MAKKLLALAMGTGVALSMLWWLAPRLAPGDDPSLLTYEDVVAYDPGRVGGHLLPDMDVRVQGERVGRGVRWITNGQGFRNRAHVSEVPPPGALRILFYGDSFVDGMRTDQDATIGSQLERGLARALDAPVEVVISGHNNPANAWYHWQEHGHRFQPDLVVVGVTVGNDITGHNLGAGVVPDVRTLEALVRLDPAHPAHAAGNGRVMIPEDGFRPKAERSRWAMRRISFDARLAKRFHLFADRMRPAMGPYPGKPGRAHAAGVFVSLGLYYRGSIPYVESSWRDWEILVPGFVEQIRHHGSRVVLLSFPTRIEALDRDWQRLVDALQLEPSRFDRDAYWQRMRGLCEGSRVPCLNSAPALRAGQVIDEVFLPMGDMHLSEHDQAVGAEMLRDAVLAELERAPEPAPGPEWLAAYRERVEAWRARR